MQYRVMIALLLAALNANAQTPAEAVAARSQAAVDAAIAQARRDAAKPVTTAPIPLNHTQGVDVGALAERFQAGSLPMQVPAKPELLIFVSTSMPKATLKLLGEQSARAGGVLLLRGLRDPLGTPNAFSKTIDYLEGAAKAGASMQIDPESFRKYGVKQVPTFVVAMRKEECATDQCERVVSSVTGDVSLDYALDYMVKQGTGNATYAADFLRRMGSR